MFLFGLHEFIEGFMLGASALFDVLHQLNQLYEDVDNKVLNVLDIPEAVLELNAISKVILVKFALKEAKGVEEDIGKGLLKLLYLQTSTVLTDFNHILQVFLNKR